MRILSAACLCAFALGCGSGTKVGHRPADDASDGGPPKMNCAGAAAKVEGLYTKAAESEGIAVNLRSAYLSANVHMVRVDCDRDSSVLPCLLRSKTVAEIESNCLLPLDDEGEAEQREFGQQPANNQ